LACEQSKIEKKKRQEEVVCEESGTHWQSKIRVRCQGALMPKESKLKWKAIALIFLS